MRGPIVAILALSILTPAALAEGKRSEGTDLTKVADFLREHVAGKSLETKITEKIDNGKIEAVFTRRSSIINVLNSRNSLVFDEIAVIEQTNFDLDKDGRRQMPGHKKDRALVLRYEIRQSKSTGALIGTSRVISNSIDDSLGSARSVRVKFEDAKLTLHEVSVGYDDYFARGDSYKPGVGETRRVVSLVDGKVRMTDDSTSYDVDPETMIRSNKIQYGTLVGREAN